MKVAKRFRWEAAHRLTDHPGACKSIHGHSYEMTVILSGDVDENGMVVEFADLKAYQTRVVEEAKENGYVETVLGRKRWLPDITSANAVVRGFAERNAINSPIQGTAADMIKLAMIQVNDEMKNQNMRSKMVLQIHDELLFEAAKDELDELRSLVVEKMENALKLDVPIIVDHGVGESWFEAH